MCYIQEVGTDGLARARQLSTSRLRHQVVTYLIMLLLYLIMVHDFRISQFRILNSPGLASPL